MTYEQWKTKRLRAQGSWENVNPEAYAAEMVETATETLRSALEADRERVEWDTPDRVRLESIRKLLRDQPVCWDMEIALLSRLIGTP